MDEKLITIPLSEYIEDLLSWRDKCKITLERAKQIAAIDSEEFYSHVQFPGAETSSPILWKIKDWKDSEKKRAIDRAKSEKNRIEWSIFKENLRLGIHCMWLLTQMERKDLVPIVYKMLRKNPKVLIVQGVMLRKPYVPTDTGPITLIELDGMSIKL